LEIPCLVIELDIGRIAELEKRDIPTLYGDAADSEILMHAQVAHARAVVITLPDETSAQIVVATVRQLSMLVPVIVRASTQEGVSRLFDLGSNEVIHPELEGGLNIVRQTLARLGYAEDDMEEYLTAVRHDHYNTSVSTMEEQTALAQMLNTTTHRLRLAWFPVPAKSKLSGQSLQAIDLPAQTGTTIVALERDQQVITHLDPTFQVQALDILGILGNTLQMQSVEQLVNEGPNKEEPAHSDPQPLSSESDHA
ncbi:MAG TPA: NAD-binding protein, partial [Ktedonobacteraceae bacterium]|nr:NAD-binding protein [Ktedonobacteraceae bacterium]